MRFIIYGAGGIGGTIGARLHLAGYEVLLIARGAHGSAMRRDGMHFVTPTLNARLKIKSVTHPNEVGFRTDDVVVMCMKSQHTEAALRDLSQACNDGTPLIMCQNGVANERMAIRRFKYVYGMVVLLPSEHLKPGEVVNFAEDKAGCLDVGRFPEGVDLTAERVSAAIARSGFNCEADSRIMRQKYSKLIMNLNNGVQAATGRGSRELSAILRNEALACYEAAGIECSTAEESAARRQGINGGIVEGYERHGGSSMQSVMRKTGNIEVDYMNGEIVWLGRMYGVPTPANAVVQRIANEVARNKQDVGAISLVQLMELIDAE